MKQIFTNLLIVALLIMQGNLFAQSIAGGNFHSHAICGTGIIGKSSAPTAPGLSVLSWGFNNYGQLGDGTNGTPACVCGNANCCKNLPVTLANSANFIAVSGGASHTMLLRNDNTVWVFGRGTFGTLGLGNTNDVNSMQQVPITNVIAIAGGSGVHSLFLKGDGTVWSCGYNFDGELGDGTNGAAANKVSPVQVLGLTGIIAIAAGEKHSLFLKNDGTVWATGYNAYGQLGDNTTVNKNTPIQIPGLTSVVAIGAGDMHSIFVKSGGSVLACGRNLYGQVGDGTAVNNKLIPTATSISGVIAVDGGYQYSMFLKSNGTVWACGWNGFGGLGDGTNTDQSTPVQVLNVSNIVQISAGYEHGMYLKNDGSLWVTGSNANGELGLGNYSAINAPTDIKQICPINIIGVKEIEGVEYAFHIYPTVSEGQYRIEGEGKSEMISVYNIQGEKVFESANNTFPYNLNISNVSNGMYILRIQSGQSVSNKRIIKN